MDAKPINILLGGHFKLLKTQEPKTEDKKALMSNLPYASSVSILMYAIVCMRLNIAQVVGFVSRYMNNLEQEQWRADK